jgi:hypothetical protein
MTANSTAVFLGRLQFLGLQDLEPLFVEKGWATHNEFAFAAAYQPGNPDDSVFTTKVVIPLLGSADDPRCAKLRFLHFESFTLAVEELKRKSRHEDDDRPKKLPALERNERLDNVKAALTGLNIEGDLEPSYGLIDKFVAMQEDGTLRYLPWADLGRRDHEIRGFKKEDYWKVDTAGVLKQHSSLVEIQADTSSDLRLKSALQRRGIALQIAGLMTYKSHMVWVDKMFREYMRDPLYGYEKISLEQLARADSELFAELSELSRGQLNVSSFGKLALDALLPCAMADPRVSSLLVPLPARARPNKQEDPKDAKEWKKREEWKKKDPKGKGRGGKDKDKDKDKAKDKREQSILPKELKGLMPSYKGQKICFSYNLQGCKEITKDGACHRGLHLCARCGDRNHGAQSSRCDKNAGAYKF